MAKSNETLAKSNETLSYLVKLEAKQATSTPQKQELCSAPTYNERLVQMYAPPGIVHASSRELQGVKILTSSSCVKRVRTKQPTRLLLVWNALALNHRRVCFTCEMRAHKILNAFAVHGKRVRSDCNTRLLYT